MTLDLFGQDRKDIALADGAVLLPGFAGKQDADLLADLAYVTAAAPLRHMTTPGGYPMSVAMTNCGRLGWVTDRSGYRYTAHDPQSGRAWPAMPASFLSLAQAAACKAGYNGFAPDACLINQYVPGAKLSLHQDKDEAELDAPIVSVSLGIPAVFQFGGLQRTDPVKKYTLEHGDVVVWGGTSRLAYHGILPLKANTHALLGERRINLTFRAV